MRPWTSGGEGFVREVPEVAPLDYFSGAKSDNSMLECVQQCPGYQILYKRLRIRLVNRTNGGLAPRRAPSLPSLPWCLQPEPLIFLEFPSLLYLLIFFLSCSSFALLSSSGLCLDSLGERSKGNTTVFYKGKHSSRLETCCQIVFLPLRFNY